MRESDDTDRRVRQAAFEFLRSATARHAGGLPRTLLEQGFDFEGRRVPLLGPQGIFKPAVLREVPLSICTVPVKPGKPRPYDDVLDIGQDVILYRYRGTDPHHPDNVGLRLARERGVPLIYFHGLLPGLYDAIYPVLVIGDDPGALTFLLSVEAEVVASSGPPVLDESREIRRRYATRSVLERLHQRQFRALVLEAYREQCSICRLRHTLEAAHILPDSDPRSRASVPNGLSLCSLHHAAYDQNILGIDTELRVEVRRDVLDEEDGPMLLHGLKAVAGRTLQEPKRKADRPCLDFVAERYEIFRKAW